MKCSQFCLSRPLGVLLKIPPWKRTLAPLPSGQPYSSPHYCSRLEVPRKKDDRKYIEQSVSRKTPSNHHALAIQTAPRPRGISLPSTLESLKTAGLARWLGPKILASDGYIPDCPPSWTGLTVSTEMPPLGSAKTFIALLRKSIEIDPKLEYLTYLQDDIVLAKNTLDYISQVSIPSNISLVSWFNTTWNKPGWKNDPPVLGCRPTRYFIRSQAMTITRMAMDAMLYCHVVNKWPRINSCDAMPDWALGDMPYADHYPSLVQHTEGLNSACNLTLIQRKLDSTYPHKGPRISASFVGENFNALELFEFKEKKKFVRTGYRCDKCEHEWFPPESNPDPTICPSCRSPHWNRG